MLYHQDILCWKSSFVIDIHKKGEQLLNPLFPVYSSLSAVRQNCSFEYLPSSSSGRGLPPWLGIGTAGSQPWSSPLLSLSSLGLLLSPCPSKEQHGWQISSMDWRAKDDVRSHLTSWCPAQRSGSSSSCTSPAPNSAIPALPSLPG